jgi:hypothetical protein
VTVTGEDTVTAIQEYLLQDRRVVWSLKHISSLFRTVKLRSL